MRTIVVTLRIVAPVFFIVGAMHLALGVGADVLLGAKLSVDAIADPALDSQNRFYGVTFTLYGLLLFLCSTNIPKYATVLRCVLWVFFTGGIARLVSIAIYGFPPPLVIALLVSELLPVPLFTRWLSRVEHGAPDGILVAASHGQAQGKHLQERDRTA